MMQPEEVKQVLDEADCLYTQAQVEQQLDRMAAEITARHESTNPIFLCVMTGAVVPAGEHDLAVLALNERFLELDQTERLPYQLDDTPR